MLAQCGLAMRGLRPFICVARPEYWGTPCMADTFHISEGFMCHRLQLHNHLPQAHHLDRALSSISGSPAYPA